MNPIPPMSDPAKNAKDQSGQSAGSMGMQKPPGFVPPTISTTVTSAPFAFGGSDAPVSLDSRPPLGGGSDSPFAGAGPVAYTTRPPWMISEPAPGASTDSGPCFVQEGDSLPPFPPPELSAAAGQTIAPFGMPRNGTAAPQPAARVENDEDAWYNKSSVPRSSARQERSVLAKLLMLFVKLMPVAMVLYGGYYGYQQFFGEISAEERAAYYRSPTAGAAGSAEAPTSRVGMMLQQAKDSIAAHDNNVHVANAIAENPGDLDGIQATVDQLAARAVEAKAPPPPQAKVTLAFDEAAAMAAVAGTASGGSEQSAAAPANFSGPMSTASLGEDGAIAGGAPTSVTIVAKEISIAEPSLEFRSWVSRVSVSGVRVGEDEARAFVSGRLVRSGMTVDHRLGIVFSHVDTEQRLLMFRDKAGAIVGKRY